MSDAPNTLVVYWADTLELLTYEERRDINGDSRVESVTPSEVLIRVPMKQKWLAKLLHPATTRLIAIVSSESKPGQTVLKLWAKDY